jgi:hypothetical protein
MNLFSLNPFAVSPSVSHPSNKSNNPQTATQGEKNSAVGQLGEASLRDKHQTALQIVNKTLVAAYEKISSRGQTAKAEYENVEPLTAEKVAGNILGFIERRLQLDAAEGATREELQARLEAGLSGFKKGFAEASEKLEALSLLSPEIKTDIGKTYDLVLEGIEDLRAKFIESPDTNPASTNHGELKTIATSKPVAARLEVPDFLPAAISTHVGYSNYEYARARAFSFELITKDGDNVTIKATSSEGLAVEASRVTRGANSSGVINGSYSSAESFSLALEGELDAEELAAINDLLGRVSDLAGQFFAGNLDGAFEQAMSLGYDEKQISSFALNLAQVEIQQITRAYQRVEPRFPESSEQNLLNNQLLPLGNFIRELLNSLDRASTFNEPQQLIRNMAEKITGAGELEEHQGKRLREFMDRLFALDLR